MTDPQRIRLTVMYDGAGFEGWQSQVGGNTIQDVLDQAIASICADASGVQGSGRTDAGVHALGQVAHFDAPGSLSMDGAAWVRALNTKLPASIRVMDAAPVDAEFHARFSATGKVYRYEWFTGPVLSPFRAGRTWQVRKCPDESRVREAAALFSGCHDFAAFAANRGDGKAGMESTTRRLDSVVVEREGPEWAATFEGEGFLYKMVRMLVGAMVRCGQGGCSVRDLEELLQNPGAGRKSPLAAPAEGLYLVRVHYGTDAQTAR